MTTNASTETGGVMPWMEHLRELRKRLMIVAACFVIFTIVCFVLYPEILSFLRQPLCNADPRNCNFYVTSPLDGLSLRIRVAGYGSLFCTLPLFLFEMWRFITPGLKARERRYALPFVLASTALFVVGMVLAYFTFSHALKFLDTIGGSNLTAIYHPSDYLKLILTMMFAFGMAFEFPVILVALELAGLVTPKRLLSYWRIAVIGIFVIAAVFTPSGDPFSMLVLAIPLVAFYFLAIGIGKLLKK